MMKKIRILMKIYVRLIKMVTCRDEGKQPSCLALLTLAKDIDELHRIVRHVLCVYGGCCSRI